MLFWGRERELQELKEFCQKEGSGLTYLRGRRRVGKSFLLKKFWKENKQLSLYFSGAKDESDQLSRKRFAQEWDQFTGEQRLSELNLASLTWKRIFQEITRLELDSQCILLFDEVQWIAKRQSGFIGLLKEAWLDWEQKGNVKVILCGSSHKFFHQNTGGEEKILRGLKTRSSIWVRPFTLSETRNYYFSKWTLEEICLSYMMLGGIPYYLEQLEPELGFVHTINRALFTQKGIFLEEIDEILSLEFNARGQETVKHCLSMLGQDGISQKKLSQKTGISQSLASQTLEKLIDYKLVYRKFPAHKKPEKNETGYRYYMKDFYLNLYFQLLQPRTQKILLNENGLLFPHECIRSNSGYYIPNFSGKAFELLIRSLLEDRKNMNLSLHKKLLLLDADYDVQTYWSKETEIDLLIEHKLDRISRMIECKWISDTHPPHYKNLFEELLSKKYSPPKGFQKKYCLIVSHDFPEELMKRAAEKNVVLLSLEDLFEPQKRSL